MRQIIVALMVALLSIGVTIETANAARFGGGGSSGKMSRSVGGGSSYSSGYSNSGYRPGAQQQSTTAASPTPPRRGLSRFLGPLAGFAAGGLLASMLLGGHSSMPGIMDIVIIGAVIFFGYRFLKRRSGGVTAPQRDPSQQNNAPFGTQNNSFSRDGSAPQQNYQGGATYDAPPANAAGPQAAPSDFNREQFIDEMRHRFIRLQKAWDADDMAQIQDSVTPEFYNVLNAERRKQPANNVTEVARLFVEMGHIQAIGTQEEATVLFHGVIREQGQESEFNETWHLIREQRPNAQWYLQGIEQNT